MPTPHRQQLQPNRHPMQHDVIQKWKKTDPVQFKGRLKQGPFAGRFASRFLLLGIGFCQDQRITWPHMAQVKRQQCQRAHAHAQKSDHYLPSLHHLSKSDFSKRLIRLSSFHSLPWICVSTPLLSLSSSRIILTFDRFFRSLEQGKFVFQENPI